MRSKRGHSKVEVLRAKVLIVNRALEIESGSSVDAYAVLDYPPTEKFMRETIDIRMQQMGKGKWPSRRAVSKALHSDLADTEARAASELYEIGIYKRKIALIKLAIALLSSVYSNLRSRTRSMRSLRRR